MYWIEWFLQNKGNDYLCEVDEDFILDRFNLTGLSSLVPYFSHAVDLITDRFEPVSESIREAVGEAAAKLYGLIHARYIITARGLMKMSDKYRSGEFGRCPRVLCRGTFVLPMGQSDTFGESRARLYCPKCEDIYLPKSTRHASLDGAIFGTTFAPFFFLSYPTFIPRKSPFEQYQPKIFGFHTHSSATVFRLQYTEMNKEFQEKAKNRFKKVEHSEMGEERSE
ncbi:hypothetical protein K502DRAFT_363272 [Neoconidiobolus thromboides FSU 785]|nr:hypothetical protein K502DRAFT_363272 [Neoconidiobolus thromboides FSU 785]